MDLTCKGEEHPSGTEQVVAPLSKREDHAEGSQDHEEEAEDGDGRCRDVVLWGRGADDDGRRQMIKTCQSGLRRGIVYITITSALHSELGQMINLWISPTLKGIIHLNWQPNHSCGRWDLWKRLHPSDTSFLISFLHNPVFPSLQPLSRDKNDLRSFTGIIRCQTVPGFCLFSQHRSWIASYVLAQLLKRTFI